MHKIIDYNKVLELYNNGLSDRYIAKYIGCQRATIIDWRLKNGLVANKYIKPSTGGIPGKIIIDAELEEYTPEESDKPWKDPESLFCDREFLESFIGKGINACKCSD